MAVAAGRAMSCRGVFVTGKRCLLQVVAVLEVAVAAGTGYVLLRFPSFENVLPEALQGLSGDVVLLHNKPLSDRTVSLLSHLSLVVIPRLRDSLKALVHTAPLPHFLKCKRPEAGPVYVHFKMAGDRRE